MATAQKSTIRRYNGVDWDPIYLATTADIVALGKAATIEKLAESPFKYGEVLEIGDNLADLVINLVNRMATLDTDVIPGLSGGSAITELEVEKLKGVIDRANLPADVGGKTVETTDLSTVTADDVNIGDLVQVVDGEGNVVASYQVKNIKDGEGEGAAKTVEYAPLTDSTSDVDWSRVKNTPDTLEGYGITDAVKTTDTVDHGTATEDDAEDFSAANKVVKTNADGKLDFDTTGDAGSVGGKTIEELALKSVTDAITATIGDADTEGTLKNLIAVLQQQMLNQDASWIKTGMLDLKVIPKVALSEMHIITSADDLATLTTEQVQQGDTVKIADEVDENGKVTKAGLMYYVADETKLGTEDWEDAFLPYTAGEASAVQWSGVLNKPTTLAGYGITDAVSSDLVTDTAEAGKLLKLNADGKLDADITGDAATLGGHAADYFAAADDLKTANDNLTKVTTDLKTLREEILGSEEGGEGTTLAERLTAVETAIGDTDTEGSILAVLETLKSGEGITALAANKLTGVIDRKNLPTDIGGRLIEVADLETAMDQLTAENAAEGDLVKLDDGKVYIIDDIEAIGTEAGYRLVVDVANAKVAWANLTGTPTTLEGYGITDAVKAADVITNGIPEEPVEGEEATSLAGKIVALGDDQKLHANLAGDAETVGGKTVEELVSKEAFDELALRVPLMVESLDEITDPKVGQFVLLPVTSNTIVTDLETGEESRMDAMAARQGYTMTDTATGQTEVVDPAALRTEDI